jgi:hypothetical protein
MWVPTDARVAPSTAGQTMSQPAAGMFAKLVVGSTWA